MSSKKLTKKQLLKFRSDVARLKEKGLVGKRVDARSQKPTRYMRNQVKQYQDVLEGKAKVVKTRTRKQARQFSDRFRTKFNRVVVPTKENETVSFAPSTGDIHITKTVKGKKVRRTIRGDKNKPIKIKDGQMYIIPIGNQRMGFDDWGEMVLFMEPYETSSKNPYKNWRDYVEVVSAEDGEGEE